IHQLPNYEGLAGDEPNRHLQAFYLACSSQKPKNITKEQLYMRAFPVTLQGRARDWLMTLAPNPITSWDSMKKAFLEKYFPAFRVA
ncbi:UNVERIFIED_CONTAM: hypothetical protein ITH36_25480, partial [Salmonella enterica subsp. enterica serovar Weltevreden]